MGHDETEKHCGIRWLTGYIDAAWPQCGYFVNDVSVPLAFFARGLRDNRVIPKIIEHKAEEGGECQMFGEAHKVGLQGQETGRLRREAIIRLRQRA